MTQSRPMTALEWLMLITLSVVWGGSFFFAAVAVQEIPPLTVAFIRVLGAAAVLWLVLVAMGRRLPLTRRVWAAFFLMGLINNVIPFSLIFWAQTEVASGLASILNAMTPIFTVVVAHASTADEKVTWNRALGVILGFAGVVVIFAGRIEGASALWAMIALLAATVSYAFATVFGKQFVRMGVAPMDTATGQVTASSVILLPVILLVDQPWVLAMPSAPTVWSLVGLVLLSTAFAYFLFFRILSTAGATNLSLVTLLIPVSAIFLGMLFLDEVLTSWHVAGLGLITAGLLAIDGRVLRRR